MVPDAQAADAQLMLLYLGFLCDETDFCPNRDTINIEHLTA